MKEQLLSREKKIVTYSLIVIALLLASLFGYRHSITSKPSYQAAIDAIASSDEVLAEVRTIESFGFLPAVNFVPDKNLMAEYVITVFGEKDSEYGITDRRVQIVVEKVDNDNWEATYQSIDFVTQSSGGNDIIVIVFLSSAIVSVFLLIPLVLIFSKQRKLLLDPQTLLTTGIITKVTSILERNTMPGESNYGVLKGDWENRAVVQTTKMFRPAVAFKAQNGEIIEIEPNFLSSKEYKKGEKVNLIYNTRVPKDALLQETFWFWAQFFGIFFTTIFFTALGSGLLILTL